MATLKIDFNCMCLFVTSRDSESVHVLMPNTSGHGADHQHVVRLVYRDPTGKLQLAPMEGWALDLGTPVRSARRALDPAESVRREALLVNLTGVTGQAVDPQLVTGAVPDKVVSRVSIHRGQLESVKAQTRHKWTLRGRRYFMAHQATFRIENVRDRLAWTPLGPPRDDDVPLDVLGKVMPEAEDPDTGVRTYELKVYHVTPKGLPPRMSPNLSEAETRHHFAAFYPLLGITRVDDGLLPTRGPAGIGAAPPVGMEFCKTAQGSM
jgi:hypothetical protein